MGEKGLAMPSHSSLVIVGLKYDPNSLRDEILVYAEFNLAIWLRLVKFEELNISEFLIFEFELYRLSLRDFSKYNNKRD